MLRALSGEEAMRSFLALIGALIGAMICGLGVLATAAMAEAPDRRVIHTVTMDAPVDEVWAMWTTNEGIQSFFAPASNIELRPQGPYEVFFRPDAAPGQRGSEGTIVLGYQTERMLSVSWAMPPYMQEVRPHHTTLTLYFMPQDVESDGHERTRLTLIHSGWGESEAWDRAFDYFAGVWPRVLAGLVQTFEAQEEDPDFVADGPEAAPEP
jgi:uncharacterized protein YndB with AHSA1/START domain